MGLNECDMKFLRKEVSKKCGGPLHLMQLMLIGDDEDQLRDTARITRMWKRTMRKLMQRTWSKMMRAMGAEGDGGRSLHGQTSQRKFGSNARLQPSRHIQHPPLSSPLHPLISLGPPHPNPTPTPESSQQTVGDPPRM